VIEYKVKLNYGAHRHHPNTNVLPRSLPVTTTYTPIRSTLLATTFAVMSDDEEADVLRAKNTVRTAYDNLQALKKSRGSTIPSSLSKAGVALDQLSRNLDLLTASSEALSIFRGYVLRGTSVSSGTSLSDAIVDDMQAIATYFRFMKPISPSEMLGNLNEQQCRDIEDMVDRYERIVHSVLSQHNMCVWDRSAP
jgi:hypothetical protein